MKFKTGDLVRLDANVLNNKNDFPRWLSFDKIYKVKSSKYDDVLRSLVVILEDFPDSPLHECRFILAAPRKKLLIKDLLV